MTKTTLHPIFQPWPASRALRTAAALVVTEGLALVALGLLLGVLDVALQPEDRTGSLLQALFALLAGLLLLASTGPLLRCRGWVRSPLVVTQLLMLPVGAGLVQGHVWWAALPVLGLPLGILATLSTRSAREPFAEPAE